MGPASHFLIGALCGAAIACVALVFRRRWALWMPPFVLACGFWAELPWLLGFPETTSWLANVFFGYAWVHPSLLGRELVGFVLVLAIANVLLIAYIVFLTKYFWAVDVVRWEHGGGRRKRSRSKRSKRRSRRERDEE